MKTKRLDVIQHANPCSEDWGRMVGDDWVRHCPKCGQNVYNLSAMTGGEAERLLHKHEGRICTKLYRRQDGSVLTQRCPSSVRRIWGQALGYAAAAGFAAAPAWAHDGCPRSRATISSSPHEGEAASVEGVVADSRGPRIPGAWIEIHNTAEAVVATATTDELGRFEISSLAPGAYSFTAHSEGFVTYRCGPLELKGGESARLEITLELGSFADAVRPPRRLLAPVRWTRRFFRFLGSAF